MSGNDMQIDRRNVLKTIGSTAVVGAGFGAASGTVTAIETKRRLTRSYSDENRLRRAFQRHGEDLRATLVDEGFVAESFDFDSVEFDLDAEVTGIEPKADDRLAGVTAIGEAGSTTALGMVSTSGENYDVALFVQPERGDAYALVEPKAGDDRFLVTAESVDVITQSYTRCTSCCGENYRTEEEVDCTIVEDECVVIGTSCSCYDCDCGDKTIC